MILFISLMPGESIPDYELWGFLGFDKLAHLGMYLILVFLMIISFCKQYDVMALRYNPSIYAILIAVIYGIIIEILQGTMMLDRFFDIFDVLANVIGCFLGAICFKIVYFKL